MQVKREMLSMRSPKFTHFGQSNLLLERFSQAINGRFPCFALISYVSPQNLSKFDPIYHFLFGSGSHENGRPFKGIAREKKVRALHLA